LHNCTAIVGYEDEVVTIAVVLLEGRKGGEKRCPEHAKKLIFPT
jgi:hypothetical protein